MSKVNYSAKDIVSLDDLNHIRQLPYGYIQDTSIAGQNHILKELIDNALDEIENFDPINGILNVYLIRDYIKETYYYIVQDNMRGVPLEKVISVFTKARTSGKFGSDAYLRSGGLFGIGAKVTLTLFTTVSSLVSIICSSSKPSLVSFCPTNRITFSIIAISQLSVAPDKSTATNCPTLAFRKSLSFSTRTDTFLVSTSLTVPNLSDLSNSNLSIIILLKLFL